MIDPDFHHLIRRQVCASVKSDNPVYRHVTGIGAQLHARINTLILAQVYDRIGFEVMWQVNIEVREFK